MYLLCKSEGVGDAPIGELCMAMSIHFCYNDVLRGSSTHARSKFTRMLNLEAQGTERGTLWFSRRRDSYGRTVGR